MSYDPSIFTHFAAIVPGVDLDTQLADIPAKWVVYLLADAENRPIQLLCVKNLRASLKRRLTEAEVEGPTRKINYRDIVCNIHWRRVDSPLEADWVYFEIVRELFPDRYHKMVRFRPAWFIHVDPDAQYPRYMKTTELGRNKGIYLGPVDGKESSSKLIELMEDLFDLCRYFNILTDSPNGKACAYKDMGKCPAPCDGSISIEQYRQLIAWSAQVLIDPAETIRQQRARMQSAAQDRRFEIASKIKAYIEQLQLLGKGPFRHVGRLSDFVFVSIQRGPWAGTAKVLLVTPGRIEHLVSLIGNISRPGELLRLILESAEARAGALVDEIGIERLGVACHHLFGPKSAPGLFLPLRSIDENQLLKAYNELKKQKIEPESPDEGTLQESPADCR